MWRVRHSDEVEPGFAHAELVVFPNVAKVRILKEERNVGHSAGLPLGCAQDFGRRFPEHSRPPNQYARAVPPSGEGFVSHVVAAGRGTTGKIGDLMGFGSSQQ